MMARRRPGRNALATRGSTGSDLMSPFSPLFSPLGNPLDSLLAPLLAPFSSLATAEPMPSLALDIKEDDQKYTVDVDIPGVRKEDITVEIGEDDTVVISGERKEERGSDQAQGQEEGKEGEKSVSGGQWSERVFGQFLRVIKLPGVDADPNKIEARYDQGVLHLVMPKKAEEQKQKQRKKVSVQ